MARTIETAARALCLALPDTAEKPSHGMANFQVARRTFATLAVNHHGDGRVALWLKMPPGAQAHFTTHDAGAYFVPPYVGPRGWLGVRLDRHLQWGEIAGRVHEAWLAAAPARLARAAPPVPAVEPPDAPVDAQRLDPMGAGRARAVLAIVRAQVARLPEVSEGERFGTPVWRAGKKVFLTAWRRAGRMHLSFRVGGELQATLTADERFSIPAFTGHNGWIALDVEDLLDADEVWRWTELSYRHFALQRMLRALDGTA